MKNRFFMLMTSSAICFTSPVFAMNTEDQEQKWFLTRQAELTDELTVSPIRVSRGVIKKIAAFLHFQDLASLEATNKSSAHTLSTAYQYEALLQGWDINPSKTFKENFINLMRSNVEYPVHFASLWKNYFPLGANSPLPLIHYWKTNLNKSVKRICSIYQSYTLSLFPKPEWKNKALIGAVSVAENQNFQQNRLGLAKILSDKKSLFPCDEADVEYELAVMDFKGQALPQGPNLPAARTGFVAVRDNPQADPATRAKALIALAFMDSKGHDLPQGPDLPAARTGFVAVRDNPLAVPATRAMARLQLAFMDLNGEARPQGPDLPAAREGFLAVCHDPQANPASLAQAQYELALMDFKGEALPQGPNLSAARTRFVAVRDNPLAVPPTRAMAQYELALMDLNGEALPQGPNLPAARNGFAAVRDNPQADQFMRAMAQYELAKMDLKGEDLPQ